MLPSDLSKHLHQQGKNEYQEDFTPSNPKDWPEEWKTTYYKEYKRFPVTQLPEIAADSEVSKLISSRASTRKFAGDPVSLQELSYLLKFTCGEFSADPNADNMGHRAYPSGGARYPTEVYVLVRFCRHDDLQPGVYHYNVKNHTLEFMWPEKESKTNPKLLVYDEWATKASAHVFFTSVFWRTQNKYKVRGYRYLCIEIGAIIQNFYLITRKLGRPCVAYGGTHDDQVEKLLALNPETESLVTSLLIG